MGEAAVNGSCQEANVGHFGYHLSKYIVVVSRLILSPYVVLSQNNGSTKEQGLFVVVLSCLKLSPKLLLPQTSPARHPLFCIELACV